MKYFSAISARPWKYHSQCLALWGEMAETGSHGINHLSVVKNDDSVEGGIEHLLRCLIDRYDLCTGPWSAECHSVCHFQENALTLAMPVDRDSSFRTFRYQSATAELQSSDQAVEQSAVSCCGVCVEDTRDLLQPSNTVVPADDGRVRREHLRKTDPLPFATRDTAHVSVADEGANCMRHSEGGEQAIRVFFDIGGLLHRSCQGVRLLESL